MTRGLVLTLYVLASAPACKGSSTTYRCAIQIAGKPQGGPIDASASGPDKDKATADAWTAVCGKLPAADQPDCKNTKKWLASVTDGSATSGGATTYTATIRLERVLPSYSGKQTSETSQDDACKAALLDACKQAGATGDCVASGAFDQQGMSASSSTGAP
jgi:hypothetical protein